MAALWKMLIIWFIHLIQARRPAKFLKILQRQERIILWLLSSLVLFLFSVVIALDSGQQLAVLTDGFFSTGLTLVYFRHWDSTEKQAMTRSALKWELFDVSYDPNWRELAWPTGQPVLTTLLAPSHLFLVLTGCVKENTVLLTPRPAFRPHWHRPVWDHSNVLSSPCRFQSWRGSLMAKGVVTLSYRNTHFWLCVDTQTFHGLK